MPPDASQQEGRTCPPSSREHPPDWTSSQGPCPPCPLAESLGGAPQLYTHNCAMGDVAEGGPEDRGVTSPSCVDEEALACPGWSPLLRGASWREVALWCRPCAVTSSFPETLKSSVAPGFPQHPVCSQRPRGSPGSDQGAVGCGTGPEWGHCAGSVTCLGAHSWSLQARSEPSPACPAGIMGKAVGSGGSRTTEPRGHP